MAKITNAISVLLAALMILALAWGAPEDLNDRVNNFWGWAPQEPIDARLVAEDQVQKLRQLAGETPVRIVLDMAQVQFLDSSGLGAVVAAMKQLGTSRKLELAGLPPTVNKVFHLTRMNTVFTIHANASDATGGLAQAS